MLAVLQPLAQRPLKLSLVLGAVVADKRCEFGLGLLQCLFNLGELDELALGRAQVGTQALERPPDFHHRVALAVQPVAHFGGKGLGGRQPLFEALRQPVEVSHLGGMGFDAWLQPVDPALGRLDSLKQRLHLVGQAGQPLAVLAVGRAERLGLPRQAQGGVGGGLDLLGERRQVRGVTAIALAQVRHLQGGAVHAGLQLLDLLAERGQARRVARVALAQVGHVERHAVHVGAQPLDALGQVFVAPRRRAVVALEAFEVGAGALLLGFDEAQEFDAQVGEGVLEGL